MCRRVQSIRMRMSQGSPTGLSICDRAEHTPPEAPLASYLAMLDATGMTNGVLVQVRSTAQTIA